MRPNPAPMHLIYVKQRKRAAKQPKPAGGTYEKRRTGTTDIGVAGRHVPCGKTLLYNDADCADAIQEAIVKAFSKRDTLKKDAYAKTWLMRILINECYGVMRREKRVVSLEDYRQEEKAEERQDYSDSTKPFIACRRRCG